MRPLLDGRGASAWPRVGRLLSSAFILIVITNIVNTDILPLTCIASTNVDKLRGVAAQLEILEMKDGLLLRVRQKPSLVERLLALVIPATVAGLVSAHFVSKPVLVVIVILGASLGFIQQMRERRVELRVTKFDFQTRGYFGDGYLGTRSVPSANVRGLRYKESQGGEASTPGLFVDLRWGSTCVLPHIDEQQTSQVIEQILQRFPDWRTQWPEGGESPFGKHVITLGLDHQE